MEKMIRTLVIAGLLGTTLVQADQAKLPKNYKNIEHDKLNIAGPTICFFSQEGCGPCEVAKGPFKTLASKHPDVTFAHVDIAKNPALHSHYKIKYTPTFKYANGEELEDIDSFYNIENIIKNKQTSIESEIDAQATTQEAPASTAAQSVDSAWAKIVAFFSMIYTKIGNLFTMIVEKVQSLFSK